MIPIHDSQITLINIVPISGDTVDDLQYKTMLQKQITWCNKNKEKILKNANDLYTLIISKKANQKLANRTIDFASVEQGYYNYLYDNGIIARPELETSEQPSLVSTLENKKSSVKENTSKLHTSATTRNK